ncbi:L-histidine N(alpha)-methyltransferase [Streptomyces griseorubiginosus]|uniref:L-histidine N(alpha)-methyltransferase n=1 Tax=Streptomyces griseorubiginosus TaxID=67304 RepID=UPI0036345C97
MADLYYSNQNLADTYHVHVSTVYNWIEDAKQGKLNLELIERNGRSYVRKSTSNIATIEQLAKERKKFRPRRAVKEVRPRPEFYETYNEGQIYDMLTNLETYGEVDFEYSYFDGGAENWDSYAQRLAAEDTSNSLTGTVELLDMSASYLDKIIESYDRVNIVDIGVGNALPVRGLLQHLTDQKKLGRYIALDISRKMLDIAERNIKDWFEGTVDFEGYELDINRERFGHLLAEDYLRGERVANVVLFLGGTPNNFRDPDSSFRVIHDSLRKNDLLIRTSKLDTRAARNFFDFNTDEKSGGALDTLDRFLFDLLNIDESLFEVERGFDPELRQRYRRIRLTSAVKMIFDFEIGQQVLEFDKGDRILLWRAWHMAPKDILGQLERNGFYALHTSQTTDEQYMLALSRLDRE